ncbi:MAG TPA: hypothetical protein VGL86_07635 [Polyangia bacterium]
MRFCLLAAFLSTACCGFSHVNDGNGDMAGMPGGGDGGAGSGGSGGGGSGGSGGGGGTSANGCSVGAPVLLVAMESVDGSRTTDGAVLQYAVGDDTVTPCGPQLTAANTLSKSPNSIAWVPPGSVAYGASDSVVLLDSASDQLRWTYRPTQFGDVPLNVFPLSHAGATSIAVGYDTHGEGTVSVLALLDGGNGMQLDFIDVTTSMSTIPLGGEVQAMVQDPRDATKIAYVDNGSSPSHPVVEVAVPWDGNTVTPSIYYNQAPPGPEVTTLNTLHAGTTSRFVWLQSSNSTTMGDIAYEIDDDGTTGMQTFGPLTCANAMCMSPWKANDAAPDPTKPGRVLATCTAAQSGSPLSNVRHVVRIDGATCDILVDGTTLRNLTYPAALAVGAAQ